MKVMMILSICLLHPKVRLDFIPCLSFSTCFLFDGPPPGKFGMCPFPTALLHDFGLLVHLFPIIFVLSLSVHKVNICAQLQVFIWEQFVQKIFSPSLVSYQHLVPFPLYCHATQVGEGFTIFHVPSIVRVTMLLVLILITLDLQWWMLSLSVIQMWEDLQWEQRRMQDRDKVTTEITVCLNHICMCWHSPCLYRNNLWFVCRDAP